MQERGSALLLAVMLIMILTTLSGALVVLTRTETAVAANHAGSLRLLYAAESGIVLGLRILRPMVDWSEALTPSPRRAGATDAPPGAPAGVHWRPLGSGRLAELAGVSPDLGELVTVWVADDEEPDGDPSRDTNRRVRLLSRATGPRLGRRDVEALVWRGGTTPAGGRLELGSWLERR